MIGLFIQNSENEGFLDMPTKRQSPISITTCPAGSTSYITAAGNTNCCEGDLVNNVCNGNDICTLSPPIDGGVKSCGEWITKEWVKRSNKFCSANLPYYFGSLSRSPGTEGCSASLSNSDGSLPEDPTRPKCKIYGNMTDELGNIDSCYNAAALDRVSCPQADAKKSMSSFGKSTPVVFTCSYIPKDGSTNGMPTRCDNAERGIEFIESSPTISAEQKSSMISMINSKKDSRYCNYDKAAIGTGYKISGDGLPSTEVSIALPVTSGMFKGDGKNKMIITQYGNSIIYALIDKDNNVMNARTGEIFPGKLSDYKIDTYDGSLNTKREMIKKAGGNVNPITNLIVTKV